MAGVTVKAIEHRLERGFLRRTRLQGVYAVGHLLPSPRATWMAAVLFAGPGAVLARRSAGALYRIRQYSGTPEVAVPGDRRPTEHVRALRLDLQPDERTVIDGIPVTTSSRTLFDLATVLDRHQLKRAIEEAEHLRLTDTLSLADLLERHPRHRGNLHLHALLDDRSLGATITKEELERRFRTLLEQGRIELPLTNVLIEGEEVDACWPAHRLIVELDGRQAHLTIAAFERDRERDRKLARAGWRVIRLTWRQLQGEPEQILDDLRVLLTTPASPARP